jgi:rhodanese-related sulfurtransferase
VRVGGRAALVAVTLMDMGYEDVAVLDGGFNAWKDAGLPMVDYGHPESGV